MYAGERFNSYSHLFGLMLALAGAAVLLSQTIPQGDPFRTTGAAVFAFSMVALYAASALFHSTRGARKLRWRRADHCAIYLLIAGTYTPFALVTLQGIWGSALLAAIWALALWGMARELRYGDALEPSVRLYLFMGWLGVMAAAPLAGRLGGVGLAWLLAGGAFYTVGTFFYRNRGGYRHGHGIWHLFVLGGTASHFVSIAGILL